MEIWKDIKDYEGFYQVSSLGEVKSLDRTVRGSKNNNRVIKGIIRRLKIDKYGYFALNLSDGPNVKTYRVHRLVAEAFVPKLDDKPDVNHINGIKTDNRPENLEWVTSKENHIHARNLGLKNSKLTKGQVYEIKYGKLHGSQSDIAKKFNISAMMVSLIRSGKFWKHI